MEPATTLVVAHYDTVDSSPGADDNGSAVAVALELARLCPGCGVLFTDLEECELLGAREFVAKEPDRSPALVLESVGFLARQENSQSFPSEFAALFPKQFERLQANQFRGDFWALLYLEAEKTRAEALEAELSEPVLALCVPSELAAGQDGGRLRDFGRSDHLAFWEKGRPALMLTDSANFRNPNYHRPSDTRDTLDFPAMARLTSDLARWLSRRTLTQSQ